VNSRGDGRPFGFYPNALKNDEENAKDATRHVRTGAVGANRASAINCSFL
jgi:hypothetical protein